MSVCCSHTCLSRVSSLVFGQLSWEVFSLRLVSRAWLGWTHGPPATSSRYRWERARGGAFLYHLVVSFRALQSYCLSVEPQSRASEEQMQKMLMCIFCLVYLKRAQPLPGDSFLFTRSGKLGVRAKEFTGLPVSSSSSTITVFNTSHGDS